jgi:hypothetical protein
VGKSNLKKKVKGMPHASNMHVGFAGRRPGLLQNQQKTLIWSIFVSLSILDVKSTHTCLVRETYSKHPKIWGTLEMFCANFSKKHSQDFNFGCL